VDYRCSDGRCSFEIEHLTDSSKVAYVHEARAGKLSDVIEKLRFWPKITSKLRTREFGVNVWVIADCRVKFEGNRRAWNFLELLLTPLVGL